jgi:ribonuclease P protein component
MADRRVESITAPHRLRSSLDHAAVKRDGRAVRGRHCLVVVLARPEEPTKVGFVASRRGVGGAVQRNRARRRLREIVRRRWPEMERRGRWLVFVPFRSVLTAPHAELVADVERLLREAHAWPGTGA